MQEEKRSQGSPWNSLEVTKIILLGILIPATGFLISREFRIREERVQARNEATRDESAKLDAAAREQQAYRRTLWENIGPKLNRIYCYFLYVGDWKETSHDQIIALKRELDSTMYTNKAFFSKAFFDNYIDFTNATFMSYGGWEQDAALRTVPIRKQDQPLPASFFTCEDNGAAIFSEYWKLQNSASNELFGLSTLNPDTPPKPPTDYLLLAQKSACGKLITLDVP